MGAEGKELGTKQDSELCWSLLTASLSLLSSCFGWCHVLKDVCANTYKEKLFSILLRIIILISLRVRPFVPA